MRVFKAKGQCKIEFAGENIGFMAMAKSLVHRPIEEGVIMEKVAHPICPFNLYFEGDEDKCNESKCDYQLFNRSCSSACKVVDTIVKEPNQKRKNYKYTFQARMIDVCRSIINKLFDKAISNHYTHQQIVDGSSELWTSRAYKDLSSQNKHYISGYRDCRMNLLEYDHIVWKVYHPTLGLIESKDVPKDDWSIIISEKSNFIWKNTINDMPYDKTAEERMNENANE